MNLADAALATPCLVVDRAKVEVNATRMRQRFDTTAITVRPHLKTVKSIEVAQLAISSPNGPATVSTLKEAEEFGGHGIKDLLYSVGIAPQKLARVTAIRQSGIDLKIIVDNAEAAAAVAMQAEASGDAIPTLIEVDVDGHRSGIEVGNTAELVAIGKVLHEADCLHGVMTHAGASYGLSDAVTLQSAAEEERIGIVTMAKALLNNGMPCHVVSAGSTPTALSLSNFDGLTEIRAGVYLFFDLFQKGVGICRVEDIALSVLTTVIGHQKSKGWVITDAGWMALSSDRSTRVQAIDQYFGVVCDVRGDVMDDLVVFKASQEHGVVALRPGSYGSCPRLPIGTRLRILPNHACATAAQHGAYQVVDRRTDIVATWPRFGGW